MSKVTTMKMKMQMMISSLSDSRADHINEVNERA